MLWSSVAIVMSTPWLLSVVQQWVVVTLVVDVRVLRVHIIIYIIVVIICLHLAL